MKLRTTAAALSATALLAPAALAQSYTEILGFGTGQSITLDGTTVALSNNAVWDASNGVVTVAGSDNLVGIDATGTQLAGNLTDLGGLGTAGFYDGATWTELGGISGDCSGSTSSAYAISDDGSTVVGLAWEGCSANAFYWTSGTGLVKLLGGASGSTRANCVSITGDVVAGWDRFTGSQDQPAVWFDLTQPPTLIGADGEVRDMSADAQTFCGRESFAAAIMRMGQPIQYIPDAPGIAPGGANLYACDAAGETFVGNGGGSGPFSSPAAILYRDDLQTITIADLAKGLGFTDASLDLAGFAFDISADGNTITGGLMSPFLPFATDAYVLELPDTILFRDVADVSLSAGGTQTLDVFSGPSNAGDFYFVLGSATGTSPGIAVDGILLPLNLDAYLLYTLTNANSFIASSFGLLDATGKASASLTVPVGTDPALAGVSLDHAAAIIDSGSLTVISASNPQGLTLIP